MAELGEGLEDRETQGYFAVLPEPPDVVLARVRAVETLEAALGRAYEAMGKIQFEGMYYRRDIGHRALRPFLSATPVRRTV